MTKRPQKREGDEQQPGLEPAAPATATAAAASGAPPAAAPAVAPGQATPAASPAAPAPAGPAAPTAEAQVVELTAALDEAKDRCLRARAELENYRKRVARDLEDARVLAKSATLADVLNALDHFQMAMQHAEQSADAAALRQGMALVLSEFERALERQSVSRVEAVSRPFDPTQHEAVSQEPSASVPAGHVLRQYKCGYRIGDRLIRPAVVVVSGGPPAAAPAAPQAADAAAAAAAATTPT